MNIANTLLSTSYKPYVYRLYPAQLLELFYCSWKAQYRGESLHNRCKTKSKGLNPMLQM